MIPIKLVINNSNVILKRTIYRHQLLAMSWMIFYERGHSEGGWLGDDLGSGKLRTSLDPAPGIETSILYFSHRRIQRSSSFQRKYKDIGMIS